MVSKFILIFILIVIQVVAQNEKRLSTVKLTGAKCEVDNNHMVNVTCRIKAVRGQLGIFELKSHIIQYLYNSLIHFQMFYKFGTIYRPYLLDFTFNLCEILKPTAKLEAKLDQFISVILHSVGNTLLEPCPIHSGYMNRSFVFDNTFEALVQNFQIIFPAGDYKVLVRQFDQITNHTYMFLEIKYNVKPTAGIDFEKFRMG